MVIGSWERRVETLTKKTNNPPIKTKIKIRANTPESNRVRFNVITKLRLRGTTISLPQREELCIDKKITKKTNNPPLKILNLKL